MIYPHSTARRDIVESMRQRHAYGATDNIVLDVRARDRAGHEWMMGDALEAATAGSCGSFQRIPHHPFVSRAVAGAHIQHNVVGGAVGVPLSHALDYVSARRRVWVDHVVRRMVRDMVRASF